MPEMLTTSLSKAKSLIKSRGLLKKRKQQAKIESFVLNVGFPGGASNKELAYQCRRQEDPLEKETATPVFLPRKSHGQRSLAGYSPWGHKSQT